MDELKAKERVAAATDELAQRLAEFSMNAKPLKFEPIIEHVPAFRGLGGFYLIEETDTKPCRVILWDLPEEPEED